MSNENLKGATPRRVLFCPAAPPDMPGNVVLGIVRRHENGPQVSYLTALQPLTKEFQTASCASGKVEFRYAAPCTKSECRSWTGRACHVAQQLVQISGTLPDQMPVCMLRPACRWFSQEGLRACTHCSKLMSGPGLSFKETTLENEKE